MSDEPSSKDQLDSLAKCADLRTQSERKKKAAIAAKRRAKVMAQMSKMQKDFIAENSELFENTRTDPGATGVDMDVRWVVGGLSLSGTGFIRSLKVFASL